MVDVDNLRKYEHIVIYGAGIIARNVYGCLSGAPFFLTVSAFIVSEKENGFDELLGIPVISVREGDRYKQNALVFIAVMDKYYEEIYATLQREKYEHIVSLTFESSLWENFREQYMIELWKRQNKEYLILEQEIAKLNKVHKKKLHDDRRTNVSLYRVCSHMDKELKSDMLSFDWEIPIQAGASLTKERISSICDDQRDNISGKNTEYCELTALYWIWKHDFSEYVGMCHYRRHFHLNVEQLSKLPVADIDVILTTPVLNFPSIRWIYAHDHIENDWNIMMEAIKVLQPDYYEKAEQLQGGVFYYAYNMFIARKEILNAYCEWLFPILTYCEEKCGRKTDAYQNRYIGFLSERLMSIYFLHHEYEYKIVHTEKIFLQ